MSVSVVLNSVSGADAFQREFIELAIARLAEAVADPGFLIAVSQ